MQKPVCETVVSKAQDSARAKDPGLQTTCHHAWGMGHPLNSPGALATHSSPPGYGPPPHLPWGTGHAIISPGEQVEGNSSQTWYGHHEVGCRCWPSTRQGC